MSFSVYNFPFIYEILGYYSILYGNQQWKICIDKVLAHHTNIKIDFSVSNWEKRCIIFKYLDTDHQIWL